MEVLGLNEKKPNLETVNKYNSIERPETSYGGVKMRRMNMQSNLKSACQKYRINYKI